MPRETGGGSTPIPTFQHSDVRLIVPLITNQDARRAELPIHKLPAADPILDYLRDVIRDCRSFTLDTSQPHHLVDQMVPIRLLAILASFQSLTHIAWDCVWSPPDIFAYVKDPLVPMPALSSLRLKHIPACECIPGAMANREDGHCNACLRSALFDTFPNLRHLHLENPVFLKDLKPPHSIETLTLDAPPLKRIVGREPYSSVIDYNIPAALRRGFMCWPKKGNTQRKIVVRAGVDTPYGWASAATACAEANIRLEKVVAYLRAIEVEQEGHNEIQYRCVSSLPKVCQGWADLNSLQVQCIRIVTPSHVSSTAPDHMTCRVFPSDS